MQQQIDEIADLIAQSQRILFITGAGLSAESGLPTYRGIGGLYDEANTEEDIPIEVALSGGMLKQRPEITWKYLLQVADACRGAGHNIGHELIAKIQEIDPIGQGRIVCIFTYNGDLSGHSHVLFPDVRTSFANRWQADVAVSRLFQ